MSTHNQVLEGISEADQVMLDEAHARYLRFTGIMQTDSAAEEGQLIDDRLKYSDLLKFSDDSKPMYVDMHCVAFMAAVSTLPLEWCQAWNDKDFAELKRAGLVKPQSNVAA